MPKLIAHIAHGSFQPPNLTPPSLGLGLVLLPVFASVRSSQVPKKVPHSPRYHNNSALPAGFLR
ncbi:hypothetical protein PG984_001041 [Apiospora sp. TS-2023a]